MTETIEIKSWRTGAVIHAAEINPDEAFSTGWKLRLAVLDALLKDVSLRGAIMRGADLSGADMRGANFSGAIMRNADLSGADMRGADFSGAIMRNADLSGADMRGASMRGADFRETAIIGIHQRADGHTCIGCDLGDDGLSIQAGCRWWEGPDALEQARAHCRTNTAEPLRAQSLRIIDYLERDWEAWKAEQAQ